MRAGWKKRTSNEKYTLMIIIRSAEERSKVEFGSSKEGRCVEVYLDVVCGWNVVIQVYGRGER